MTYKELKKFNDQIDDPENIADMLVIRKGATNGDVITAILKSSEWVGSTRDVSFTENIVNIEVGSNWWYAPYKENK